MTMRFWLSVLLVTGTQALADEGMWTLSNFPHQALEQKYDLALGDEWLQRVRQATVRLEGGCTGSLVSANGLVLTNHHCVRQCIRQMSDASHDYSADGFLARERAQEIRCESQQVSILTGVEEITDTVETAIRDLSEQEANQRRKGTLTQQEQNCEQASLNSGDGKLYCESVSLYNGGQYFLYKYRRYEDVRMVFVPEASVAAFGGDPDNFNFPRWCLDMAFLRVYENGSAAQTPRHLRWRREGPAAGEPVFVSGHPGSTERLLSVAELRWQRDVVLPNWLLRFSELRGRLIQYGSTGPEPYRIVQAPLMSLENSIKVRRNELRALLNDQLIATKNAEEKALRAAVASDPALEAAYGTAWAEVENALDSFRGFKMAHLFVEDQAAFNGVLFTYARQLLRAATEREKSNTSRLRAYTEAALPQLRQMLLARDPVYENLETLRLAFSLEKLREWLGPDSEYVHEILGQQSPQELARALVRGTRLGDPAIREALWEGGLSAVEESDDPMIQLAIRIEPDARALRSRYESEVEAPMDRAAEKIARARFAIEGTSRYPDATFSLRISYGSVRGWQEDGSAVAPFTRLARLFERATGSDPFRVPDSWLAVRSELDPGTRFNYVADTDITGGNSGSPIVDKKGFLVGLAFDGNIHSIAGSYWFDDSVNRTVAVHPQIMLSALETIYEADELMRELSEL